MTTTSLKITLAILAATTCLIAQPRALPAQEIPGATLVNGDPVEQSKYLGTTYKSEADGFRLTPPAGSRIVRRAGVDLVSFIVDAKRWGGSLQLMNLTSEAASRAGAPDKVDSTATLGELVGKIKNDLNKNFKAVEVLQEKPLTFGGKPAVRFDIRMQASISSSTGGLVTDNTMRRGAQPQPARGGAPTADVVTGILRQQLIVQTHTGKDGRGTQFHFLTLDTPLDQRDAATKTFEAMLTEFTLFDSKTLYKHRSEAVAAGKEWLLKNDAGELAKKLNNQPQYFLQQVESKNVGFIALQEATKVKAVNGTMVDVERSGRKGVLMTVVFGSFLDGAVTYGQIEEFWAYSKDARGQQVAPYSEWNIITKSQIKESVAPNVRLAPGQPAFTIRTPWLQETGYISQDSLASRPRVVVIFGGDLLQKQPPGLNVMLPEGNPPTPLPKVLEYTWTRMVDVTKPSEMSFVTYDSRNNKLATRNLIVTGLQESIKVNGRSIMAYKCIDEIDPNNTTLWVDRQGQIQLMKTSDQTIFLPTTIDQINKLWPNRPTQ